MAIVCITEVPTDLFDTHIAISIFDMCQMACASNMAFGIFDINDAHDIQHLSCQHMAIWVSKDSSGPQECRQWLLNGV